MTVHLARHSVAPTQVEGPAANERLTAWSGSALLVLFAVEGVTLVLGVRRTISLHVFVGLLVIGPVLLKLASTGYRFVRYYTGRIAYRLAGPPRPLLRVLAPFLILATVAMLASGVALLVLPAPFREVALLAHKASFVGWFGLTTVHVLAYLPRLPRLLSRDTTELGEREGRGAVLRLAALGSSLAVGLVLAAALVQRAQPWTQLVEHHRQH